MSDCESSGLATGFEILPAVIYIVAKATLHITVLGIVPLVLSTKGHVVDTLVPNELVGNNVGLYVTKVSVGERIRTEGGEHCVYSVARSVGVRLHDINSREVATLE